MKKRLGTSQSATETRIERKTQWILILVILILIALILLLIQFYTTTKVLTGKVNQGGPPGGGAEAGGGENPTTPDGGGSPSSPSDSGSADSSKADISQRHVENTEVQAIIAKESSESITQDSEIGDIFDTTFNVNQALTKAQEEVEKIRKLSKDNPYNLKIQMDLEKAKEEIIKIRQYQQDIKDIIDTIQDKEKEKITFEIKTNFLKKDLAETIKTIEIEEIISKDFVVTYTQETARATLEEGKVSWEVKIEVPEGSFIEKEKIKLKHLTQEISNPRVTSESSSLVYREDSRSIFGKISGSEKKPEIILTDAGEGTYTFNYDTKAPLITSIETSSLNKRTIIVSSDIPYTNVIADIPLTELDGFIFNPLRVKQIIKVTWVEEDMVIDAKVKFSQSDPDSASLQFIIPHTSDQTFELSGNFCVALEEEDCETEGIPECSDDYDNDLDGWVDWPDDGGCGSADDPLEEKIIRSIECSDKRDNDGDGLIDGYDYGCKDSGDNDERTECEDGRDNDGDGLWDGDGGGRFGDPGCWDMPDLQTSYNPTLNNEGRATSQCQDGINNDEDEYIDNRDPGCYSGLSLSGGYDKTDYVEETFGTTFPDSDRDGWPDILDNCPDEPNDQQDTDLDGIGDACDDETGPIRTRPDDRDDLKSRLGLDRKDDSTIFSINNNQEFAENTYTELSVRTSDIIKFTLQRTEHFGVIDDINQLQGKITITFSSAPQTIIFNIGQPKAVNFEEGGIITILVNEISLIDEIPTAQLTIFSLPRETQIPAGDAEAAVFLGPIINEIISNDDNFARVTSKQQQRNTILLLIISIIIVLSIIYVLFNRLSKRRIN